MPFAATAHVACWLTMWCSPQPMVPPRSAQDAVLLLERSAEPLTSMDVWYRVKWTQYFRHSKDQSSSQWSLTPEVSVVHECYRMRWQPGATRVQQFADGGSGSEMTILSDRVVSGMTEETSYEPKKAILRISLPRVSLIQAGCDYRIPWLNLAGNYSAPRFLSRRKNLTLSSGDPHAGGFSLRSKAGPDAGFFGPYGFVVDCSPNQAFMPFRLQQSRLRGAGECAVLKSEVAQWHQCSPHFSVPSRIETLAFSENEATLGKTLAKFDLIVDVARSRWNDALAKDAFSLSVPEGATVEDSIRDVTYTKGRPETEQYLNRIAQAAADARKVPILAERAATMPPVHSDQLLAAAPWWRTPYAYAIYAVLAFAVVLCVYRRRQAAVE